MLEKILIKEFQCHEKLLIEFGPGVTTLVGPSRAGKSAVLRALRWLVFNRPSGDSFQRHTSYSAVVVRLIADASRIFRRKNGNANEYRLEDRSYRALKGGVPDAVDRLLNLGPVNFQGQHDAPFWFSLTPGEVSRELNEIVDLGLIDKTLKNLSSEVRKVKAQVEVTEERLKEAERRKKELDWVPLANKDLGNLEKFRERKAKIEQDRSKINDLLQEGGRLISLRKNASLALLEGKRLISQGEKAMKLGEKIKVLENVIQQWNEVKGEQCRLQREKEEIERKLSKLKTCPACGSPMSKQSSAPTFIFP